MLNMVEQFTVTALLALRVRPQYAIQLVIIADGKITAVIIVVPDKTNLVNGGGGVAESLWHRL